MPVGAGVEVVAAVVAVHQVDPAGDLADVLDHGLERVAARVRMTGVEAEAHHVETLGLGDGLPHAGDPLEVARHRVGAARGVLDQQRDLDVGRLDRLAPVVEPYGGVVVVLDVAAVHDQPLGADRRGGVHVLLDQLAPGIRWRLFVVATLIG